MRAASGLAWWEGQLAVIQDDANFIALVDPESGLAEAIALPAGPGGVRQFDDSRANKAHKLDLEALASVPGSRGEMLLAIGSGSTAMRESLVILDGVANELSARVQHLPLFFAALRAAEGFVGTELNVEGALFTNGRLWLFGRGNGMFRGSAGPVNATCEVGWSQLAAHLTQPAENASPTITNVVQHELGDIAGISLGFTDAASVNGIQDSAPRVLYTAAAEASPDATRDGPVAGSAIGVICQDSHDDERIARWTELRHADGELFVAKAEGIVLAREPHRALVVIDRDQHDRPSELCEVALDGPWFEGR